MEPLLPTNVQQLVDKRMATGRYPSPEAVLVRALEVLEDFEGDIEAIQEGIDDELAGRHQPVAEVDARLRQMLSW